MDVRVEIDDKIERNDRGSGIELSDGRRTLAFRKSKPRAMIFFLSLKINVSLSLSLSLFPGGCFTKEQRLLSALIVYRRISSEQSIPIPFPVRFESKPLPFVPLHDSRRGRVVSKERISVFTVGLSRSPDFYYIANQSFHLARRQVSSTAFVPLRVRGSIGFIVDCASTIDSAPRMLEHVPVQRYPLSTAIL